MLPLAPAQAEDGYDLWLRYAPLEGAALASLEEFNPDVVYVGAPRETVSAAVDELSRGLSGLLGRGLGERPGPAGLIFLSCASDPGTGGEGFVVRSAQDAGRPVIQILAAREIGCLYGAHALLRELSQGAEPT